MILNILNRRRNSVRPVTTQVNMLTALSTKDMFLY